MVWNNLGMMQNYLGMMQNYLGMMQNYLGMLWNDFGMVQNYLGMVRNDIRFGTKRPKKWCKTTWRETTTGRNDWQPSVFNSYSISI